MSKINGLSRTRREALKVMAAGGAATALALPRLARAATLTVSVFLAVMFYYSPFLTWIVIASFPFYVVLSALVTPVFRRRLDEKFNRGAENQAFLVESVTGVETLKAMAVEPQMQRRWEEQLAGYVAASFKVLRLGNTASNSVQLVNKVGLISSSTGSSRSASSSPST